MIKGLIHFYIVPVPQDRKRQAVPARVLMYRYCTAVLYGSGTRFVDCRIRKFDEDHIHTPRSTLHANVY
jgi:hypothetical protein